MPLDTTGTPDEDPFAKYNTPNSVIMFPVAERHVGWETRQGSYDRIRSHKAIIRVAPGGGSAHVLSVVGSGYKLVHNKDLYSHVETTLCKQMQHHELAGVMVKDRVSGWGRVCFREYVFPNIKCQLGGGTRSDIAFRMIVQNGYGGSALRIHAGAIEFYCTNGMIRGEYQSAYRKHTSGLMVSGIGNAVSGALSVFADSQNLWRRWAATPVPHQAAMDLFRELANSERLRENLSTQYLREREARGDNLWAVYSALTYYASHADGEFGFRSSVNEQDSVATSLLHRELNVAKWVEGKAWKQLEDA